MPILDDHTKLKAWAEQHKVQPGNDAWKIIQDKLKKDKVYALQNKRSYYQFKFIIAASFLVLLGFFSVIYLESIQPQIIEKGQVESVEELFVANDYFYSLQNARKTYQKNDYQLQSIEGNLFERASSFPIIFRHDPF